MQIHETKSNWKTCISPFVCTWFPHSLFWCRLPRSKTVQPSARKTQANGCDLPTQKMIGKNGHSSQMVREDWNHLKRKVPRKSITKWQSGRFFCDVRESHPKKSFIQSGTGYIIHSNAYFKVFRDVKYHDSDQVILHPDLEVATSLIAHYTSGFHIMNL